MRYQCENCSKEFRRAPSSVKKNKYHFCSMDCRFDFYRKNGIKIKKNHDTSVFRLIEKVKRKRGGEFVSPIGVTY